MCLLLLFCVIQIYQAWSASTSRSGTKQLQWCVVQSAPAQQQWVGWLRDRAPRDWRGHLRGLQSFNRGQSQPPSRWRQCSEWDEPEARVLQLRCSEFQQRPGWCGHQLQLSREHELSQWVQCRAVWCRWKCGSLRRSDRREWGRVWEERTQPQCSSQQHGCIESVRTVGTVWYGGHYWQLAGWWWGRAGTHREQSQWRGLWLEWLWAA